MKALRLFLSVSVIAAIATARIVAAEAPAKPLPGDEMITAYFKSETAKLAENSLADIKSLADWEKKKGEYRQQLFEMLSLSPMPPRTDLKPVVTGKIDHELVTVENVHFQSMPGLYVTANLYLPKHQEKPAPTVLYVCGHAKVSTNGVSYGNKTAYQHHGIWFARNGYVCLVVDTVQLGEIEGIHHGTYREGMWWWNARGYTSAGVEAWNAIRALDYLQSRPEVDGNRIGVTGRSGGGAYSWWVTALDDRIKVAAPVAGITDLQNHVVDGVVEGHCDCMFIVNTYRWDYPQVAALVAPRPLLICNSDKDTIFPLDGVNRVHQKVRQIYRLHKAEDKLGLLITEGPHKDTQDLQVPVFRWFNRHLKGEDAVIEMAARPLFTPQQLKVFKTLPADERTSKIHETFVAKATNVQARSADEWAVQRDGWLKALREKSFAAWPADAPAPRLQKVFSTEKQGLKLSAYDFESQNEIRLRLYLLHRVELPNAKSILLQVHNEESWANWLTLLQIGFGQELQLGSTGGNQVKRADNPDVFNKYLEAMQKTEGVMACVAPRGIGPTAWNPAEKKQIQIRRRFMLLGQTLEGMRVWDIRRTVQAIHSIDLLKDKPLAIAGSGQMAVDILYASLFEPGIASLQLAKPTQTHQDGPDFLNVLRILDIPQATALAAERCKVQVFASNRARLEDAFVVLNGGADQSRFDREMAQARSQ